jgi:hypothetical protein
MQREETASELETKKIIYTFEICQILGILAPFKPVLEIKYQSLFMVH